MTARFDDVTDLGKIDDQEQSAMLHHCRRAAVERLREETWNLNFAAIATALAGAVALWLGNGLWMIGVMIVSALWWLGNIVNRWFFNLHTLAIYGPDLTIAAQERTMNALNEVASELADDESRDR